MIDRVALSKLGFSQDLLEEIDRVGQIVDQAALPEYPHPTDSGSVVFTLSSVRTDDLNAQNLCSKSVKTL